MVSPLNATALTTIGLVAVLGLPQAAEAEERVLDFSLAAIQPPLAAETRPPRDQRPVELSFELPVISRSPLSQKPTDQAGMDLFEGGSDSLVAIAVGSAEGTRTPAGDKTWAYDGHVDPGNGHWNLGSFSFQHCSEPKYQCSTPEAADLHQLRRLQSQLALLHQQAADQGITLTLAEELNGLDLANQAPRAALERGYIDWLKRSRDMGLTGTEAILWARVRSFLEPDTGLWNAPGLGNDVARISADQERRIRAIALALEGWSDRMGKSTGSSTAANSDTLVAEMPSNEEDVANQIIFQNL
jgi:hypothetical protein